MLAILFYCLKVLIISGLLLGYYLLALRNKQFHEWNRYYLLMVVLLSFALPFLHIPIFYGNYNNANIILRGLQFGNYGDEVIIRPNNNWQINWNNLLIAFYACISFFFLVKLIKTFNWIKKIRSIYPSEMLEEIQFYNTTESGTPFSYFKNIFWHKDIEPSSSKGLQMLRHEITHVRQLHSADKLLMEITTIMAWWNPFFHLIKKELSTIHEFIADQHAANGDDNLQYASLLLQKAFGSNNIPLSNPFFHSQLKRRIAMLTTIKNARFSYLRRLMVLPLAATLFILMAFKFKEKKNNDLKTPVPLTIVIDAGHGGIDDGVVGENGEKEKNITLSIANKILELADKRNIHVILTRSMDELPGGGTNINNGLRQRTLISANSNADLFLSIHVNKNKWNDSLQNITNSSGIMAFVTRSNEKTLSKSSFIASALLDELEASGLPVFKNVNQRKNKGVWVLDSNPLPAVLLELGFIDNPTDAAFISNPKNQEKLANEILDGLVKASVGLKNRSAKNMPIQQPSDASVLNGYLPDSVKVVKKSDKSIKKTVSKNVFEASQDSIIADSKKEELDVNAHPNSTITSTEKDTIKPQPLYFIDGVEAKNDKMQTLIPKDIKSINVLKGKKATDLYGDRAKNGVILIFTKKNNDIPIAMNAFYQDTTKDDDKTFTKVEQPATFPGGLVGWRTYLEKNLRYPELAQEKKIQGVVKVQLVVDKQGHVSDVKALNQLGGGLSEEAERVIKTGPDWVPAKQNGKLVTYRFVQTLTFQLQ